MKELFVNGTLMRGLELHSNLSDAEFIGEFKTAPCYRLYSIDDIHPGMYEIASDETNGVSVAGEIYRMSDECWAKVESGEPPYLYCGPVKLDDGRTVDGILFPREKAEGIHKDISDLGDWRIYEASKA
ncbi:hypothetical protein GO013_03895 [Pseudodesulfovibrio sp. JC047]|uniref:allophanate hydrolase-related protein n=1 Tax=Pseudodesulfovibrio sp. JC047 TaxID=2683199 RepID=UPI0013D2845E|nr:gamma-glutamylcyclotransferase [Pseudodesulfovibrio sp. JC047]NDV18561.1 hypothetical protein [Pseudodesulfovibrio sp. JC047]